MYQIKKKKKKKKKALHLERKCEQSIRALCINVMMELYTENSQTIVLSC